MRQKQAEEKEEEVVVAISRGKWTASSKLKPMLFQQRQEWWQLPPAGEAEEVAGEAMVAEEVEVVPLQDPGVRSMPRSFNLKPK